MASELGLNAAQRLAARKRVVRSAMLGYQHASLVHYTQGGARWQGIARNLRAMNGQYPTQADCSSYATWCHWDATRSLGLSDYVNGANWLAGYTGTQAMRGKQVTRGWLLKGDLVFYGGTFSVPGHVAIVVKGGRIGSALVVSHGSEGGPYLVKATYRSIMQVRRYIR